MKELGRLVSRTEVYEIVKIIDGGLILRNDKTGLEFDTYLSRAKMTPFTVMTDDEGLRAHVRGVEGIEVVSMKLEGLESEAKPVETFPYPSPAWTPLRPALVSFSISTFSRT